MLIAEKHVKFQIDSGASVNVILEKYVTLEEIAKENVTPRAYNGSRLEAIGRSEVIVSNTRNNKKYKVNFVVVNMVKEGWLTPLSARAAEQIKLLTVHYENFTIVNAIKEGNILQEYQDIFDDENP